MLRDQNGPLFESSSRPLLKSSLRALARYGTHQKTISGRPELMYAPFVTRLEWPGDRPLFKSDSNKCRRAEWLVEGPLFELDSNKHWMAKMRPLFESPHGPLLKSGLEPLFIYDTHQTTSGILEQVYLPSDPRLEWPGEGPIFELDSNKCQEPKCGHCCCHPGPLFMSGLGPWPDMAQV